MAGYDAALVALIDERIRLAARVSRQNGTVVGMEALDVLVAFDGDPTPAACKYVKGLGLIPGMRVLVELFGSQWIVTQAFGGYWPRVSGDPGDILNISNTAAAVGSTPVGPTFYAPVSGSVWVTVSGYLEQANAGNNTYLSWQIRTGEDYASGTNTVYTFDFERGLTAGAAVVTGGSAKSNGSHVHKATGLTPMDPYTLRLGHWVSPAGAGTVRNRMVYVDAAD